MRKILIYSTIILFFSSCARSCQGCKRNYVDNTRHNVRVTLYSGGKEVKSWEFYGIVSNSSNSDGYYFYINGNLVEVCGDVVIEYL